MRKIFLFVLATALLFISCNNANKGFTVAELQEYSRISVSPDSLLTPEEIQIKKHFQNEVMDIYYKHIFVDDKGQFAFDATAKDFTDKGIDVRWYYTYKASMAQTNKYLRANAKEIFGDENALAKGLRESIENQKAEYFAAEDKSVLFEANQALLDMIYNGK